MAVRTVALVRRVTADIVAGQTLPAAAPIVLPEDLHRAVKEAAPEGERSVTAELQEPLETSAAHGRGQVGAHERSGGVRPARIRGGGDGGGTRFTAEADGRPENEPRFSGGAGGHGP